MGFRMLDLLRPPAERSARTSRAVKKYDQVLTLEPSGWTCSADAILTISSRLLGRLAQRFEKYRPEYRRGLDEYSLRNEYPRSLFEALGWDVRNTKDDPPFMRDVRVEYRPMMASSTARPITCSGWGIRSVCLMKPKKFPRSRESSLQVQNYVLQPASMDRPDHELRRVESLRRWWKAEPRETVQRRPGLAPLLPGLLGRSSKDLGPVVPPGRRGRITGKVHPGSPEGHVPDRTATLADQADRNRARRHRFLQYLEASVPGSPKSLIKNNTALRWNADSINEAVQC